MAVVKLDTISDAAPPPPDPASAARTSESAGTAREAPVMTAGANGDLDFSLPGASAPAPALAAASFAEGVPLDFTFYALRNYVGEPVEQAVENALAAIREGRPLTESIAADELVVGGSLYTHPCLYADAAAIDDGERIPQPWLDRVNQQRPGIEQTVRAVGRIQLQYFDPPRTSNLRTLGYEVGLVIGTGVVIAPGVIMTNRHVAAEFALADGDGYAFLKDGRSQNEPVVSIDFGGVYDELPNLHRIDRVVYIAAANEPDVALLGIRSAPGREAPPPVRLQTVEPAGSTFPRDAFVVGYPTTDPSDSRVPDLFRTLRVKRVSLGQIKGENLYETQKRLYHNCTTLGGSSGSPLVDFETGTVWGLHFYGRVQSPGLEGNLAEPMWRIAELPAVREALGAPAADEPVSFSVPEIAPPVVERRERPVLFVRRDDIAPSQPFPDEWFAPESAEHDHVRASLPAAGLVRSRDRSGATLSAATGFLIGPDLLLTFQLAWQPAAKKHKRQGVFVDFAKSVDDEEPAKRIRALEMLYRDGYLSLLRLETRTDAPLPAPLPLQRDRPVAADLDDAKVFVVGHPAAGVMESTAGIFPPPYLVKRLALGRVQEDDTPESAMPIADLRHDCSTTFGDAGAPVISLASGQVLGIHLGGEHLRGNFAMSMWSLLAKPEIDAIVS